MTGTSEHTPQPAPFEAPLLSRTGTVSPFGALTEDLKTKVDVETFEQFKRACAKDGRDASKALRNYVYWVVYGKDYEQLEHEARQRRRLLLMPEGPNGAQMGDRS